MCLGGPDQSGLLKRILGGQERWAVFESKNLLNNALAWAVHDRLCSAVYCGLNTGVNTGFDESKVIRKQWRELGAYALAHVIVLSLSPEGADLPNRIRFDPWIAEYLRPYDKEGLFRIVEQWLAGEPLDERICEDPRDEDLKVRHLKRLIGAIHDSGKPTAGRIIP
jgi:hypothetical protein